jgi:hypothetical protein
VNRPVPGLTLESVVDGLATFRRTYRGKIWLEVMVLAGIDDGPEQIARIARLARRIAPDRIQLNTPVRPTFDERAAPVPAPVLEDLCGLFPGGAEVIAEWGAAPGAAVRDTPGVGEVLALLRRRPCSADDVAAGLALHPNAVVKALTALERRGEAHRVLRDGRVFWHAVGAGRSDLAEDAS